MDVSLSNLIIQNKRITKNMGHFWSKNVVNPLNDCAFFVLEATATYSGTTTTTEKIFMQSWEHQIGNCI
jgi:hypothetical protein